MLPWLMATFLASKCTCVKRSENVPAQTDTGVRRRPRGERHSHGAWIWNAASTHLAANLRRIGGCRRRVNQQWAPTAAAGKHSGRSSPTRSATRRWTRRWWSCRRQDLAATLALSLGRTQPCGRWAAPLPLAFQRRLSPPLRRERRRLLGESMQEFCSRPEQTILALSTTILWGGSQRLEAGRDAKLGSIWGPVKTLRSAWARASVVSAADSSLPEPAPEPAHPS